MLDVDNATRELLAAGLISLDAVFDGDLSIQNVSRRNRNLRVSSKRGPSYLIKQAAAGNDGGTEATLRAEIGFYEFVQSDPAADLIRSRMPKLVRSSVDPATLYLELLGEHHPLWRTYATPRGEDEVDGDGEGEGERVPPPVPVDVARALGRALGEFHRALDRSRVGDNPKLAWLHGSEPWILSVHKPGPAMLSEISAANMHTVRILQNEPGLSELLDAARGTWEPSVVMHGDIKSDNVLARVDDSLDEPDVRLVDWELVQWGDPAWDLAGALQDFACYWIHHIPLTSDKSPEEMVADSKLPLSRVQPASRSFWFAYVKAAGLDRRAARERLLAAVRFSAARLVQTAYEFGSAGTSRLPNQSVAMLQVAANIIRDPEVASLHLYGVPPGIDLDATLGSRRR